MEKKLNRIAPLAFLGLFFVIYCVALFVIFEAASASLWIGFIFTVLAFAVTGCIIWFKAPVLLNAYDQVYKAPAVFAGGAYAVIAMVLGMIAAAVPAEGIKWIVLIELIVFAAAAVVIVLALSSSKAAEQLHRKDAAAASELTVMRNVLLSLADSAEDPDFASELRALAEVFRFSLPDVRGKVAGYDSDLRDKVASLQAALAAHDEKAARGMIPVIRNLLNARNRACKVG